MPSSWRRTASTPTTTAVKDPYNPVDAIFAAARYLKAAGARPGHPRGDLRLQPRRLVRRLRAAARAAHRRPARRPRRLAHRADQGHFPVAARATYADDARREGRPQEARQRGGRRREPSRPHRASRSSPRRARRSIAVKDARVVKIGTSARLGQVHRDPGRLRQHVHVRQLAKIAKLYPAPKPEKLSPTQIRTELKPPRPTRRRPSRRRTRPSRRPARRATSRRRKATKHVAATTPASAAQPVRRAQGAPVRASRRAERRRRPAARSRSSCARGRIDGGAHAGQRARPRPRPDRRSSA